MSATAASTTFKPLLMAETFLSSSFPSILSSKPSLKPLPISQKLIKFQLPHSHTHSFSSFFLKPKTHFSLTIPFVAQTSDWAQQEEENNNTITLTESEQEQEQEQEQEGESFLEDGESIDFDLQAEGEDAAATENEAIIGEGDGESGDEEGYVEPPEEAKIFVGNLPYDVDSEKLAMLFDEAGTVEVAEVIYDRESDRSRGFGFVTMSTVKESEKAVEMFHRYELDGRFLTVNKAAPRGSRPEPPRGEAEPGCRIYVGNLPWDVDSSRLEQVFSEHGKVVSARVVSDRDTGRSRGFGFVTMSTQSELDDAIAALDGENLGGRAIRVNVAEERPRRNTF